MVTAGNGREGVERLQQTQFDMVITDIVMPGMDGNQVADYIRRSSGAVPTVIGMSGTIDLVSRSKFDVVFKKPFAIKTFLSTVAAFSLPANLSAKTGRA